MPKTKPRRKQQKVTHSSKPYETSTTNVESKKKYEKKDSSQAKQRRKSSANLSWLLRVYKGLDDWHLPVFKETKRFTGAKYVLYPGCHTHVTPSLVFPHVVYVDNNKKVEGVFNDEKVIEWVNENKGYDEDTEIKFLYKNFDSNFEEVASFDLMISACAGIVSKSCAKYLKPGGHFLVSDAHFDARGTYVRKDFKLVGVYGERDGRLLTGNADIKGHFHTTKGEPITESQVEESIEKPKSRRSFKLKKEAMFYLFKKLR